MKRGIFTAVLCLAVFAFPSIVSAQDEAAVPFLEVTFQNYRQASTCIEAVVEAGFELLVALEKLIQKVRDLKEEDPVDPVE